MKVNLLHDSAVLHLKYMEKDAWRRETKICVFKGFYAFQSQKRITMHS